MALKNDIRCDPDAALKAVKPKNGSNGGMRPLIKQLQLSKSGDLLGHSSSCQSFQHISCFLQRILGEIFMRKTNS